MKKMNDELKKNVRMPKEVLQCEKIENLYNQILTTEASEGDYRSKLIHELLQLQKTDGSFSVIDDYRCDSDIRVVYVYFPTYYASAAIIYVMTVDGNSASLQDALTKSLAFAIKRRLVGHGYDATRQQLEALDIYKKANLYEFLQKYGKEYPDFQNTIKLIIDNYRTCLAENRTVSDWMVDFRSQFERETSDYDMSMFQNVWYAAYGSNISKDRFMNYVMRCKDPSAPTQSMPLNIDHNIYFAGRSSTWEGKGKAFLDDSCPGMTLGRMYLITMEQFLQIQHFEGPDYSKKIYLGSRDGFPIYTFTASANRSDIKCPSKKYLKTILAGLQEAYPDFSKTTLYAYLLDSGIVDDNDREILSFVRNSAHGVSLQTISDATVVITKAKKSIRKLVDIGLLKQDRRSIEAGHRLTSNEAVFYTDKEHRDEIVLLLLMHR